MKLPVDYDLLGVIQEVNLMYLLLLQKMARQGHGGRAVRATLETQPGWGARAGGGLIRKARRE